MRFLPCLEAGVAPVNRERNVGGIVVLVTSRATFGRYWGNVTLLVTFEPRKNTTN